MKKLIRNTYLSNRFFLLLALLAFGFMLSFIYPAIFGSMKLLFYLFLLLVAADFLLVFITGGKIHGERVIPDKLSNGDENTIHIVLYNRYPFTVNLTILDELPQQFQKRDFGLEARLGSNKKTVFNYILRPVERGIYEFGKLNVFVRSGLGLLRRRFIFDDSREVPVYPSFLQLKKYDLMAFTDRLFEYGVKKIRRIGHTMEFEQIRDYVAGDDIRIINWKATAKKNQLMVNQHQDEKSQSIYSVIDKGRVMKMPFEKLSLLDYAINATLVISSIAIKKQDKAGMFAFSNKIENRVVAEKRSSQMNLILETLYNLKTNYAESDFSRLYVDIKRHINQRSLLLLYTNFETLDALHRQIPYLQALNKQHLLVVILFENTELTAFARQAVHATQEIFQQTLAEKFVYEKKLVVYELRKYGIQTILTKPQDLTLNTINKYLEIKARGLL